ncbi:MAG: hypothetical protein US25_C0038G0010 [Candidatus Moranbacteria bacterium GW2011_GWE1_36_7]|nr:MAG: hypothetical protein US16_C0048G0012 [Candidatus Moranbacteria bacterium GW2011_GWE2_36_40]KKQ13557.1 MAG: hypothetical protein US25_C0038G0010 [Candidatus Moranbacteria bacterium GW2011_GWE1_36_7]KKQ46724.1 MAG: hypothetical protein US66_C0030G0012 [Candidatus Moranbacteria bacterium GW2011_GWD2_37_9]
MFGTNKSGDVLRGMMKNNHEIGRSLALEKKKDVVLGIMEKQGIKKDVGMLKGYKQKEFLKAVDKETSLGFYVKKAMHNAIDAKKVQASDVKGAKKNDSISKQDIYREIIEKGKNRSQEDLRHKDPVREKSNLTNFLVSNKNLRAASDLLVDKDKRRTTLQEYSVKNEIKDQENNDVRNALRRIQTIN